MPAASPTPKAVPMKADMKIPALAQKLGLTTLVKLLGDADLVDALNGDGEPIYLMSSCWDVKVVLEGYLTGSR